MRADFLTFVRLRMDAGNQFIICLKIFTAAAVICNGFFGRCELTQVVCAQAIEGLIEHNCVLGDILIRRTAKVHQFFPDQLCARRFIAFLRCHFNVKCTGINRLPCLTHRAFDKRAGKLSRVLDNLADILIDQRIRIIFLFEAAFIIRFVFDGGNNVNIQLAAVVPHDNILKISYDSLVEQVVKITAIVRLILAHGIVVHLDVNIFCKLGINRDRTASIGLLLIDRVKAFLCSADISYSCALAVAVLLINVVDRLIKRHDLAVKGLIEALKRADKRFDIVDSLTKNERLRALHLICADCVKEDFELPLHFLLLASRALRKSGNKRRFPVGQIINGLFNIFRFCNIKGIFLKRLKVLPVIVSILVNRFLLLFHQIKDLDEHIANRIGVQELIISTYQICLKLVVQANVALRCL